jgi:hypothetical protein
MLGQGNKKHFLLIPFFLLSKGRLCRVCLIQVRVSVGIIAELRLILLKRGPLGDVQSGLSIVLAKLGLILQHNVPVAAVYWVLLSLEPKRL